VAQPPLTAARVRELLDKLAPAKDQLVLIGGQALSLWAERYGDAPELRESGPHTSKDIDFYGKSDQEERCAALLGGTYYSSSTRKYRRNDLKVLLTNSLPRLSAAGEPPPQDTAQLDVIFVELGRSDERYEHLGGDATP